MKHLRLPVIIKSYFIPFVRLVGSVGCSSFSYAVWLETVMGREVEEVQRTKTMRFFLWNAKI